MACHWILQLDLHSENMSLVNKGLLWSASHKLYYRMGFIFLVLEFTAEVCPTKNLK